MLIHYENPSFYVKKDFYKKAVDNLDIGSTKDESSNGFLLPIFKDNIMKNMSMSSYIFQPI